MLGAWQENATSAKAQYGRLPVWDTSNVTDMSDLLCVRQDWMDDDDYDDCVLTDDTFNEDIGGWDTSSVTSIKRAFRDAYAPSTRTSATGTRRRWRTCATRSTKPSPSTR